MAFEIAQRRALERLTLQVKQEEQDETPPSKSPKSPQPDERLTDRVTYLAGSQFSSLVELCCGVRSQGQQAGQRLGIMYLGVHAQLQSPVIPARP